MTLSACIAGIAALVQWLEIPTMKDADVHLLLEGARRQGGLVQGGSAVGHGPELRQDLGRRQEAPLGRELGNLLHDTVPELLGLEAVELVLDRVEPGLDPVS
jgi:hypothetical protein